MDEWAAPDSDSTFAEAQIILAIYDKPVRVLLKEMIEDLASQKGQRFSSSPWQKCNFLNWDSRVSAKTEQR